MIEKFHKVSISGRYIYGYLCLRKVIQAKGLETLPEYLDSTLTEFVSTNRLDLWQIKADKVLPSAVLKAPDEEKQYEAIPNESILRIKRYYESQPLVVTNLIEEVIWLGLSNLYGGFDSNITIQYVQQIIEWLVEDDIELPPFEKIQACCVQERNGWGSLTVMSKYL